MHLVSFNEKLTKLNPRLYIDQKTPKPWCGHLLAGIYLKSPKRAKRRFFKSDYHGDAAKYISALEAGYLDQHVSSICLDLIPEWDIWDLNNRMIKVRGWRTVLLELARKKVIDLEKARKIFSCSSLGLTDYEQAPWERKLEMVAEKEKQNA